MLGVVAALCLLPIGGLAAHGQEPPALDGPSKPNEPPETKAIVPASEAVPRLRRHLKTVDDMMERYKNLYGYRGACERTAEKEFTRAGVTWAKRYIEYWAGTWLALSWMDNGAPFFAKHRDVLRESIYSVQRTGAARKSDLDQLDAGMSRFAAKEKELSEIFERIVSTMAVRALKSDKAHFAWQAAFALRYLQESKEGERERAARELDAAKKELDAAEKDYFAAEDRPPRQFAEQNREPLFAALAGVPIPATVRFVREIDGRFDPVSTVRHGEDFRVEVVFEAERPETAWPLGDVQLSGIEGAPRSIELEVSKEDPKTYRSRRPIRLAPPSRKDN